MDGKRCLTAQEAFPLPPKNADGTQPCRVCGKPAGGLRTCSRKCRENVSLLVFVEDQRIAVFERDQYRCVLCGLAVRPLKRILCQRGWACFQPMNLETRRWVLAQLGFKTIPILELDHIIPVSEDGGVRPGMTTEEILGNLRTLCSPCHKAVTKEWHGQRTVNKTMERVE